MDGEQVTEEQLAFLVPDVTTKEEVIRNLGNPNVIWEDARVFAYDWVVRQGILVWAVGGGYQGYAGIEDIPKRYSFLIQFDEHDRVQSFEKVVRPSLQSYGDFLTEWVRNRDKAAPSNSNDESE